MLLQELIVPLLMDTTKFNKGADSASERAIGLKDKLLSAAGTAIKFATVTAAVTAVGKAIKGAIDTTVKWADELDALQDVTDLTNSQAAGLNYVLRKHGVDANTAATAFTYLNKQLVEYDGKLGATGNSLKKFGIDVQDANGQLKDNASITQEIANKYLSLAPGAERIGFLTDVFGKSSLELNDALLELGEKGFNSFISKAEKLGLNIDADKVQAYKQSVSEMGMVWEAVQVSWGIKLIPYLETITDYFASFAGMDLDEIIGKLQVDFDKIDWDVINKKLNFSIAGHDWSNVGQLIADIVVTTIKEVDWSALGNSLASVANNLWAGLFGLNEAQAQKIIKQTLNDISRDIETWVNNTLAYIAGLGFKISANVQLPRFDMSHPATGSTNRPPAGTQAGDYTYDHGVYTLNPTNRANGGMGIAGQAYNVSEFYQPEVFVPQTNGRFERMNEPREVIARFDEDRLLRVLKSASQQGG